MEMYLSFKNPATAPAEALAGRGKKKIENQKFT